MTAPFGARVIRVSAGPLGPAHARNAGAATATGDILLFIDADVLIRADTLERTLMSEAAGAELNGGIFWTSGLQPGEFSQPFEIQLVQANLGVQLQ